MDRLPREAALAGCIVLTNREGAAKFDQDVPLPREFKFDKFDVDRIYSVLKDCCKSTAVETGSKYDDYVSKMEPYKKWILGQELQMKICVNKFMEEIITNRCK